MKSKIVLSNHYKIWLSEIKLKVRNAQIKAAIKVNKAMLLLYWEIGADIIAKQKSHKWGDSLIDQLSKDLMSEFPEMKGFSRRNLMYIQKWYLFYVRNNAGNQFVQQLVAQITQIPWGHNIVIISKCKNMQEALYYVKNTVIHNWSRSILVHQIESGLYKREGKSVNNFDQVLPKPHSDLAKQSLKDPYVFDFLSMASIRNERELEDNLITHITKFLLELGAGFAYLGSQIPVTVGGQEFLIDLLFYHVKLHCYVVVELKTVKFEPEFAGKINFYLKAVDSKMRSKYDKPAIGILICKNKNKMVAEYALSDIKKLIGVSMYKLTNSLPAKFKPSLPTIKDIESELKTSKNRPA